MLLIDLNALPSFTIETIDKASVIIQPITGIADNKYNNNNHGESPIILYKTTTLYIGINAFHPS